MSKPDIHTVVGTLAGAARCALFQLKNETPSMVPPMTPFTIKRLERALAIYDAFCGGPADDLESALRASLKERGGQL